MDTPRLPAQLTLYTVSHPEGGWCAIAGCTEPFVTFCESRAQELADKVEGAAVVAHLYHQPRGVLHQMSAWLRGVA
jgi:hypothetical protein